MVEAPTEKKANPLDTTMTTTQVVRRRFKSKLPRTVQNRALSKMEAMARTMELFDQLRDEMHAAGLNPDDAQAGLVFYQPETPGKERELVETIRLPRPEEIGPFVEKVMALDKPHFLGVLFAQSDPQATKAEYKTVAFVYPFLNGPEAEARLLAARNWQILKGR
jgi:hypothetical protein